MRAWALLAVVLAILAVGYRIGDYLANQAAKADLATLRAELSALEKHYAELQAKQQAQHQAQLKEQLERSRAAEKAFLTKQQQLTKEQQRLKEQLNEATADTDCTLSPSWLQHYRQALGVPATPAANPNGAGHSRGAADAAITATELLQHATQYGAWCQQNTAQLTALQCTLKPC